MQAPRILHEQRMLTYALCRPFEICDINIHFSTAHPERGIQGSSNGCLRESHSLLDYDIFTSCCRGLMDCIAHHLLVMTFDHRTTGSILNARVICCSYRPRHQRVDLGVQAKLNSCAKLSNCITYCMSYIYRVGTYFMAGRLTSAIWQV